MTTWRRIVATGALAAGAAGLVAVPAGGASASQEQSGLREVREATRQFKDVGAAVRAGYAPTDHCVPGMGYHYLNESLVQDPAVDALRPEVLLYAPDGRGGVRLIGVEWFKVDTDGLESTVEQIEVLGQRLHGPMTHGLPLHYDLHAYVWSGNPDGVFATENRSIRC